MKLCKGPGCMRAINDDARFCDECRAERKPVLADDGQIVHSASDRQRYAHLYNGERWKRDVQPRALKKYPICCKCSRCSSELIDHIVPAGEAIRQAQGSKRWPFSPNAGFYLMSNLQGLCRSCHAIKTAEDKAHLGAWPSVMEAYDRQPKKVWSFG